MQQLSTMSLPAYPAAGAPAGEMCFEPDVFVSEEFSVDQFVCRCRQHVSVEQLREELLAYYQTVKSAMVELINKDYADFVGLSSNLVGMDQQIEALANPLSQLLTEIKPIKSSLDNVATDVECKLAHRVTVRNRKAILSKVMIVVESLERLQLMMDTGSDSDRSYSQLDMDRIAMEFNRLQYTASSLYHLPVVQRLQPEMMAVTEHFQSMLELWFTSSLQSKNHVELLHCLETYALVTRQHAAEQMFQGTVIQPYVSQVVSTKSLLTHPDGLSGMYAEVLQVVPLHCTFLLDVCASLQAPGGGGGGGNNSISHGGFDFLVNSAWPGIVSVLESKVPVMFAPGNPDNFYRNYTASMLFVSQFEQYCHTQADVRRLRAHPSYTAFISKWSLPVYFQIRFQEIAGILESVLMTSNPLRPSDPGGHYRLEVFNNVIWCINRCWSEGVFLHELQHRFWKLTLQLLLRVSVWLKNVFDDHKQGSDDHRPSVDVCVSLVADIESLINEVTGIYKECIVPKVSVKQHLLKSGLDEACHSITDILPQCSDLIVEQLSRKCGRGLEAAHTIPRLYRRTNREVPSKASGYVSSIMNPLSVLGSAGCSDARTMEWRQRVVDHVTRRFHDITKEVLTSVQRTEDSLQKLKRSRRSLAVDTSPAAAGCVMSDDNKIRLQLAYDIDNYLDQVRVQLSGTPEGDNNNLSCLPTLRAVAAAARTTALSSS